MQNVKLLIIKCAHYREELENLREGTVIIRSHGAPYEIYRLLVQNGLASPDLDLDNKLTEGYLSELFTVLGAQVSTDTPDLVMTRGDLAQFLTEE